MSNFQDDDVPKAIEQLRQVDDQLTVLQARVRDIVAMLS